MQLQNGLNNLDNYFLRLKTQDVIKNPDNFIENINFLTKLLKMKDYQLQEFFPHYTNKSALLDSKKRKYKLDQIIVHLNNFLVENSLDNHPKKNMLMRSLMVYNRLHKTIGEQSILERQKVKQISDPEQLIRYNIQNNLFRFYKQAIMNVEKNDLFFTEMLLRVENKHDKDHPLLAPSDSNLMPVFLEYINDPKITISALSSSLKVIKNNEKISVNVESNILNETFITYLEVAAKKLGLRHSQIIIEISNRRVDDDIEMVEPYLRKLKEKNFLILLDNFGAGKASLFAISKFRFDYVKLDKFFTQDKTETSQIILEGLLILLEKLKLKVIATNIETQNDLNYIKSFGIEYAQGYFLQKPEAISA